MPEQPIKRRPLIEEQRHQYGLLATIKKLKQQIKALERTR